MSSSHQLLSIPTLFGLSTSIPIFMPFSLDCVFRLVVFFLFNNDIAFLVGSGVGRGLLLRSSSPGLLRGGLVIFDCVISVLGCFCSGVLALATAARAGSGTLFLGRVGWCGGGGGRRGSARKSL